MDVIFKIMLTTVLSLIILGLMKEHIPEYAIVGVTAVIVLIAIIILPEISGFISETEKLFGKAETNTLILPVIKVLVISTVMKILSDMCIDSGERSIGHLVEIVGVVCALAVVVPLVMSLVESVGRLI